MYRGERYSHFQSGQARVDAVLGEFYWAVARGEMAETDDYVKPPYMLSREVTTSSPGEDDEPIPVGKAKGRRKKPRTTGEINWSLGTYQPVDELWQAFAIQDPPPRQEGVGPNQPNPLGGQIGGIWTRAILVICAVFFVFIALSIIGSRLVLRQTVSVPPGVASGAPEAATFAGPFDVFAIHSATRSGFRKR